jgi:hypothetical protein
MAQTERATSEDPFAPWGSLVALGWSVQAMDDATDRVNKISEYDMPKAFAAIGEAVWWITIVNDTLSSKYRAAYDFALDGQTPRVEDVIEGLRSVRHRIGHEVDLVDFIEAVGSRTDRGDGRITAWKWKSIRAPTRSKARDVQGHRAYESAVAERNFAQIFMQATGFLRQAHANARDGFPR